MWVVDKIIPLNTDTRILPNIAGMLFANSNSSFMTWNSPLWFLPCMFVSLALMDFWETMLRRTKWESSIVFHFVVMIVLWAVGILVNTQCAVYLPLHIEAALFLTGFSELGYIISRYSFQYKQRYGGIKLTCRMLILYGCFGSVLGVAASCFNGWTDIRTHLFGQNPLLLITTSVSFSLVVVVLSMLIRRCRWLEYLGIHSMAILVMHKFPVMFFKMLVPGIQEMLNNSGSVLGFAAGLSITVLSIVVCVVCERILMTIFPFALGANNKKREVDRKK